MQADDQPWCGAEMLPHATLPDGTPAPILCTSEIHSRYSMHYSAECATSWRWQDADGNWLSVPAMEFPS